MKYLKSFGAALALILSAGLATAALIPNHTSYSAGTTNGGTSLSWAITSAHSANDGQAIVTYIDASTDATTNTVRFYKCDAVCVETYATNSTTTLSVNTTNGIFDGGVVVIRHVLSDTYEKRIAGGSPAASTNLVLTVAPITATVPGDIIYHMTATASPVIQAVTNSYLAAGLSSRIQVSGPNIFAGSYLNGHTTPILAEVTGQGNNATLNTVTVQYQQPVVVPRPGL